MNCLELFDVYHNGELKGPLVVDVFSTNKELLALLRVNKLFCGRKAEFSGSIRDQLDIQTSKGLFSLKNVSRQGNVPSTSLQVNGSN